MMASGGYTVKLLPGTRVPESCYCPHCKLLLKNAVQTGDGDRLCETCFKAIVDMPGHVCKECGIKVDPREHSPDIASRKEISKVNVLCHNTDQGCGWSGLLKDMDAHLEECGYKKVKCDLCHEGVLAHYIAQHMANECPERTGNCAIVMQETLNQHTSELVYGRENLRDMSVAQSGPPAGRGVEQQLLVMNQQLQKVMDRLDVRAAEIKQLKRWILGILSVQLQASLASSFTKNPWQIPNVGHRIQELKSSHVNSIYSPPYYTGCISYKMCLRVYLNGDGNLSATLFYVFTNGEDIVIEGPLEHKVSLILIDQERNKHLVQTFKPNPISSSFQLPKSEMNVASGCPQFCSLSVLNDPSYVKNDTMSVRVCCS